jgi:hypothetical protein
VRRPKALDASALLIDENRRLGPADRLAKLRREFSELRRIVDVALEEY